MEAALCQQSSRHLGGPAPQTHTCPHRCMETIQSFPARPDQAMATSIPGAAGAAPGPFTGNPAVAHNTAYAPGGPTAAGLGKDAPPASTLDAGVARAHGRRWPRQLDAPALGPSWRVSLTGAPGERRRPRGPEAGGQDQPEVGRGTARPWDYRRIYGYIYVYIYPLLYTPLPNSRWLYHTALTYVQRVQLRP